jgi:hypothetical protein
MSVNSKTGEIRLSKEKQIGTYFIKINGILPDKKVSSFTFKIDIIRNPLLKVSIKLDLMASKPYNFTLPFIQENSAEYVTHLRTLPSYASFNFPSYSFLPISLTDMGISVIEGKLWNPFTVTSFKIKLNVTNTPPYY